MSETIDKNKVHYDLQYVFVAPLTLDDSDSPTFGSPKRLNGAIGMDLSAQGDPVTLRADGINYYVNTSNQGYQGDLTMAMVPDWFRAEFLGQTVSTKDKVLVENAKTDQPKAFALIYEFQGDRNAPPCPLQRPCNAPQRGWRKQGQSARGGHRDADSDGQPAAGRQCQGEHYGGYARGCIQRLDAGRLDQGHHNRLR